MTGSLVDAAQCWDAAAKIRAAFADHGFRVPAYFQAYVLDSLSPGEKADVVRYWDETAREYVSSLGRSNSDARQIDEPFGYRSPWLDEYAARQSSRGADDILVPALRHLRERELEDFEFRRSVVQEMRAKKAAEYPLIAGLSTRSITRNSDKPAVLRDVGKQLGYDRFGSDGVIKQVGPFRGVLILHGGTSRGLQPMLQWKSYVADDRVPPSEMSVRWDRVVPGFEFYSFMDSTEEAVLGMYAAVFLMSTFLDSL